ncbi:hypothetical protein OFN97_01655 [Campylobacter sp. VBCF_05 NA6]|uniref:hypothetical protein n=1 Tax=unclassified Campylobacter TaxID=2593542 RepID=UPI0022E9F122|nr:MULTISPECIES: hypothetical protein [unclassified Campylobacter]MDA3056959.1 hypothetical protein [Campylobacter sp. VBCF_04 NA7]MDA3058727.1 hypothetical protein [Campylobacter sp. VBCF_05 NA6]
MRVFLFLTLFFGSVFAVNVDDVRNWDQIGQYNRICQESVRNLFIEEQNEALANTYAKACLKMDRVNELVVPMVMLYKTKETRENASLYSTIVFQKKMLYLALCDGVDISYIRTPKINYILSEIFDKFVEKTYTKKGDVYVFTLDDGEKAELFIKEEEEVKKMVVAIYAGEKLSSIKIYW